MKPNKCIIFICLTKQGHFTALLGQAVKNKTANMAWLILW